MRPLGAEVKHSIYSWKDPKTGLVKHWIDGQMEALFHCLLRLSCLFHLVLRHALFFLMV